MRLILNILIVLSLLGLTPGYGQYTVDTRIKYTVNDGLPSSTCYDIKQDQKGYIWIATEGGLSRFDGSTFHNYNTQDGLVDNEVIEIAIDSKDRIWMNTNNVLSYMHMDSVYTMKETPTNHMLSWNFDIIENGNELWIARMNHILVYDLETLESIPFDDSIYDSTQGGKAWLPGKHEDRIWVVDNFFNLHEYKNRVLQSTTDMKPYVQKVGHYNLSFKVIYPHIYYPGEKGLHRLNLETKEDEFFCEINGKLRRIEFRNQNNTLYALTDELLSIFHFDSDGSTIKVDTLMKNQNCSNLIIDDENNLWGAIYRNGIFFYPPAKSNLTTLDLSEFGSNNLESIIYDDGVLVAGTAQGELYFIQGEEVIKHKLDVPNFTLVNRVLDIVALGNKTYLVAFDVGLFVFKNGEFEKVVATNPKNLYRIEDKVVISTYRQTDEIKIEDLLQAAEQKRILNDRGPEIKKIDRGRVYSAIQDKDKNYWIGNSLEGLKKHNDNGTVWYRNISNKFKSTISRIIELENGIICIATKGEGLLFIKDEKIKQLTTENGLTSNFCYDVSADKNKIFLSTNRGAHIIDLIDFEDFKFSIDVISTNAGLKTNEVIQMVYAEKKVFIATNEGMATLNLEKEQLELSPKEMHVNNIQVNGTTMPIQDTYEFEPNQNSIYFRYNSPQYSKDHGTIYSYKMEGVDKDWTSTTSYETYYRNLGPGTYEFKYRLVDKHLRKESNQFKSIQIKIKPKFTDTSIFKLLALLGIGTFIFILTSFFLNKKKQRELSSMVEEKTLEVQEKVKILEETNTLLQASNEELEQFAYIASHDLQEPINTISGFSDLLKKRFEKQNDQGLVNILNIISSSSSRMKDLVQDLLDFSRLGREKEKVKLDLNLIVKNAKRDLQEKINNKNVTFYVADLPDIIAYEFEIYSLFLNLISNAIKYQKPDNPPIVRITYKAVDNDKYEFSIKDNGIGIKKENQKKIFNIFQRLHNKEQYQGTGIGLAQCKKIVEIHGGEIWVKSEENEGSNFKFTLEK